MKGVLYHYAFCHIHILTANGNLIGLKGHTSISLNHGLSQSYTKLDPSEEINSANR